MRIAFLNRQREAHPGGDLVMIDALQASLKKLGIEAVYAPEGWTIDWLKQFDLVHIFHINFGWSKYNITRTWESKVPYVISPIFYPDTSLGMSVQDMWEAVERAEAYLPNSHVEAREMKNVILGWPNDKSFHSRLETIPNGTDLLFHHPDGGSRPGDVICIAARKGDKNTDLIEAACQKAGLSFKLAQGLSRAEVARELKTYKLFVNSSTSERMAMTTGEALCAGCKVIDTIFNRGNEWYGPALVTDTPYPSAGNADYWARKLRAAIDQKDWDYSPNQAARRLTWDYVANRLLDVYTYITV